jgi:hypothetical protein
MSDELKMALEQSRAGIEAGLVEAEKELAELRERERELEGLVARAKAALGAEPEPRRSDFERLTLHEAIALVLQENGNGWMTVRQLADEVNRRELYRKRDGSPVEPNQIHARAKNYTALFEKDGPLVRLLMDQVASSSPSGSARRTSDEESG